MLPFLIVTADDFGASLSVNEAVERAHKEGILTATSLMVAAPFAADALARAKRTPSLRVGLHVVLVEGRPQLDPSRVPDLVTRDGHFRTDMARAGAAMFFLPSVRQQMEAEIAAQFEAFAATGLALDHVNTHKHFHLHPSIAGAILRIGKAFGLKSARVPLEPLSVLRACEPDVRAGPASITAPWAMMVGKRFREAGMRVPDSVFGLAWSGALTAKRLKGIIAHLPPGLSEIYCHPATRGGWPGAAPGYRYAEEFAALIDPDVVALVKERGIRLGGFGDFA